MKKIYEQPQMEVETFDVEDIVRTSDIGGDPKYETEIPEDQFAGWGEW